MKLNQKVQRWVKEYWLWVLIGLFLINIFKPDFYMLLGTNSIFNLFGLVPVSFSILLFLAGVFLIIVPEPTTTMFGVVLAIAGLITGFTTIVDFLQSIFGSLTSPLFIVAILIVSGIGLVGLVKK